MSSAHAPDSNALANCAAIDDPVEWLTRFDRLMPRPGMWSASAYHWPITLDERRQIPPDPV